MRSREAIIIFLTIIVATTVFIGYKYFVPNSEAIIGNNLVIPSVEVSDSASVANEIIFDFEEPETFEEMKADLLSVGCDTMITLRESWQGMRELSYSDALKLVRKANWVGFIQDEDSNYLIAFVFYLDGTNWYWMKSAPRHISFEKIEITSAYCEYDSVFAPDWGFSGTEKGWVITLDFRNTGTTDASIIDALINSKKIDAYGTGLITGWEDTTTQLFVTGNEKLVCVPGTAETIYIIIQDTTGISFTSGTTIEVAIHTGAGNTYMKMVTLS